MSGNRLENLNTYFIYKDAKIKYNVNLVLNLAQVFSLLFDTDHTSLIV